MRRRQPGVIVTQDLFRFPAIAYRQAGAVLRDLPQLIGEAPPGAFSAHSYKPAAEGLGNRFGLGFARLPGEFGRQPRSCTGRGGALAYGVTCGAAARASWFSPST